MNRCSGRRDITDIMCRKVLNTKVTNKTVPQSCSCIKELNALPDEKNSDSSKLKEFLDDNFKFDENGRQLSKWIENTVGIGEIARYEQFLIFPQCFRKVCFPGASKGVIVWEWINSTPWFIIYIARHSQIMNPLNHSCLTTDGIMR